MPVEPWTAPMYGVWCQVQGRGDDRMRLMVVFIVVLIAVMRD